MMGTRKLRMAQLTVVLAATLAGNYAVGIPRAPIETSAAAGQTLRPVAAFASIAHPRARAIALFSEMGKVLQHPRCVNCHPAGDRPLQTDSMRPHQPLVVRGASGHGAPGMECSTCHHAANYDPAHVPGHPQWHLAPIEMAWEGKTLTQICEQIKDPARNGGKNLAELVHHLGEDSLVGWGCRPGWDARQSRGRKRISAPSPKRGRLPARTVRRDKSAGLRVTHCVFGKIGCIDTPDALVRRCAIDHGSAARRRFPRSVVACHCAARLRSGSGSLRTASGSEWETLADEMTQLFPLLWIPTP
jgi:hypothetical protein